MARCKTCTKSPAKKAMTTVAKKGKKGKKRGVIVLAHLRIKAHIKALDQVIGELSINEGSRESYAREIAELLTERATLADHPETRL